MSVTIGARRVLQGAVVLLLLSTFGLCSTMEAAIAEQRLPLSRGLVSDFAGKLSPATKRQIETLLLNFRNRTGIEVAVVTIPFADMQGYPIEEYALRLGRQWGLGRDSQKRALLLLVAIKPPNAQGVYSGGTRLEVSRHLEGDVPDILAGELIRKMRDGFVAGRFDQALTTGTQTILATLAQRLAVSIEGIDPGEAARRPVRQPVSQAAHAPTPNQAGTIVLIGFLSLVGLVIYAIYRGLQRAARLFESADHGYARGRSLVEDPEVSLDLATGGGTDWSSFRNSKEYKEWRMLATLTLLQSADSSSESSGGGSWGGGGWTGGDGGGSWGGGGGGDDFGGYGGGGDFGGGGASDSW